jgi:tripartite-type tricarboxylate transporter receptor subunit TctC
MRLVRVLVLLCAASWPWAALAQAFPSRSLTLVVPFPAGGPADFFGRHLAKGMSERLGQSMVIDNKSGAAGVTGMDAVAKSTPDGHMLGLISASASAIMPNLMARMPYEPTRDLAMITLVVRIQEVLVVHAGVEATSLQALVARAKAAPGKIAYGSAGTGGITHLAGELLAREAGIEILHVPYRGAAPAVVDLLAGRVQMAILDLPALLAHIRSGAVRGLAVTSTVRSLLLPDVPTTAESGYPSVLSDNWYGLVAPAATPPATLQRLHAAAIETLKSKDVIDAYASQGGIVGATSPADFAEHVRAERDKWGAISKAANIKID